MKKLISSIGILLLLFSCTKPETGTGTDTPSTSTDELKLSGTEESIQTGADKSQIPISFTTNRSWTVSSNVTWITVNPKSGESGTASIIATVEANSGSADRTGKVTIEAGKISKTVTINQSHSESKPAKDVLLISVTNIDYTSYTVSVTTNTTKSYFWDVIEKSTWDSYGGDAVWNAYIEEYKNQGLLSQALCTENSSFSFTNQTPKTNYIAFAAFCDSQGVVSGSYFTEIFITDTGLEDTQTPIQLSASNISENSFTLSTSTQSTSKYYCGIVDKTTWDAKGANSVWKEQIGKLITEGTILDMLTTGDKSKKIEGLETKEYVAFAAYCYNNGNLKSSIFSTNVKLYKPGEGPDTKGKEYVDLGLSVRWAHMNVGATKPEEYGDHFQWAGTDAKNSDFHLGWYYTPYQVMNTDKSYETKWVKYLGSTTSEMKFYGTPDADALKTVLDPEDDAASKIWGGDWRMPTKEEWEELANSTNCSWTWTNVSGVNGYKVQSKKAGFTDKWIFLPAAGYYQKGNRYNQIGESGNYWSSSLHHETAAYCMGFSENYHKIEGYYRNDSNSVRPVIGK